MLEQENQRQTIAPVSLIEWWQEQTETLAQLLLYMTTLLNHCGYSLDSKKTCCYDNININHYECHGCDLAQLLL